MPMPGGKLVMLDPVSEAWLGMQTQSWRSEAREHHGQQRSQLKGKRQAKTSGSIQAKGVQ